MDVSAIRQFFLRPAFRCSQPLDLESESALYIHVGMQAPIKLIGLHPMSHNAT